ncbi:MAG: antibiotic biosynthesis monooxygenase [Bacteroidales bacterium]|nr:antibiotic biosynthesis monooxygenase [Bacteroidales bacterium]
MRISAGILSRLLPKTTGALFREPGNVRFDVLQQADDNSRFMIYEVFESEEAAKAHKEMPHYLRWRDTVKEFMADERFGVRYNIIEPSERSEW